MLEITLALSPAHFGYISLSLFGPEHNLCIIISSFKYPIKFETIFTYSSFSNMKSSNGFFKRLDPYSIYRLWNFIPMALVEFIYLIEFK